jgi:hypothetical protein
MHDKGGSIAHPTAIQIEKAIRNMDGLHKTMVILAADNGAFLGVGGGNDGNYVVSVTLDNGMIYTVIQQGDYAESEVLLNTGGQAANYPAEECVDLETALHAAKAFSIDGSLQPSLQWR